MSEHADGRRRGGALVGRADERDTIDTLLAAAEDAQSGALVPAGVALGVAAAIATLLLRRPPATPASEADGQRATVEEAA